MSKSILSALLSALILLATANQINAQPTQLNQKSSKITDIEFVQLKSDIGTEKFPLVVKIPQEKSKDDLEKEAYERGEKRELDRKTTNYAKVNADYAYTNIYLTIGLLLVAFLQALLFLYQLRMMKSALNDSKNASEAASTSAMAAKDSADIAKRSMIASERAYVHQAGVRFTSHPTLENDRIFWRFHPAWINVGNTPTRNLRIYIKYELLDKPLSSEYEFKYEFDSTQMPFTLAPRGSIESVHYDIFENDLDAVRLEKKYFYIWGIASYKSVFSETDEHITKFCLQITNITGYPLQVYSDKNLLDMSFSGHGKHNCTDEDCLIKRL
jgi:hypothetical protein